MITQSLIRFLERIKVGLNLSQLSPRLAFAKHQHEPFQRIAIGLAVIASAFAVTQRNNVFGNSPRASGIADGYPMIHREVMPQARRTPAYSTAAFEVSNRLIPVFRSESGWELQLTCAATLLVSAMLLWISLAPCRNRGICLLPECWIALMVIARLCTARSHFVPILGDGVVFDIVFALLSFYFRIGISLSRSCQRFVSRFLIIRGLTLFAVRAQPIGLSTHTSEMLRRGGVFGLALRAYLEGSERLVNHLKLSSCGPVSRRWEGAQGSLFSRLMTSDLSHRPILPYFGLKARRSA